MERILCVWSPAWAIANWKRRNPSAAPAEGPDGAFALVQAMRGARRLFAVDDGARARGLFVGQKATDAAALAPDLVTADADPLADDAALAALCDWCARFSPAVALDPPDGLILDITGVAHLWGGERPMARDLIARLARNGIPARAAVASTIGAAWALAHFGPEAAEALDVLPVAALRLDLATAAQIGRLGLTTIGALSALPRDQVTRRFGKTVILRLDQALGREREALVFRRPATPWFARRAFAEPISAPEDLARVTRDLAQDLCADLEALGQGARRFELTFHRLDGVLQPLNIGLALPGRSASAVGRLFQPLLERIDPGFGIEVTTLTAEAVQPVSDRQVRLDDALEIAAEDGIAPLIDRLTNRLGEGAVWRAEPFPSHLPERAAARRPPLSETPKGKRDGGWDLERPRPLRLFRRPELVEATAPLPDDPPLIFRWRRALHRVRRAEGPERLSEEWWRRPLDEADPSRVRDYYRVEDETGARFWLFRDGLHETAQTPRWWLHGLG